MRLLALPLLLILSPACREPGFLADRDMDGFTESDGDCDDADRTVHPEAPEQCNGIDDDCNGTADDGALDMGSWYVDEDGDGWGVGELQTGCDAPEGGALVGGDCNDEDAEAFPGAPESCQDDSDRDCDGALGTADEDNDGYANCEDCNDLNRFINPGAEERCNDIDDNCDGESDERGALGERAWYADADSDGFGANSPPVVACNAPTGYVDDATDCDDRNAQANPSRSEVCDGFDNNCDGAIDEGMTTTWYLDADSDGRGRDDVSFEACEPPTSEFVEAPGDCDDDDPFVRPGVSEVCDDVDTDCDGSVDFDDDGDGWSDDSCGGSDCDDDDNAVVPDSDGVCALGAHCSDIMSNGRSVGDGVYTVDIDGADTGLDPEQVYCNMSDEGGGWTLVYAYSFTNYGVYNAASNAVWPIPSWNATVVTSAVSTQTPLAPDEYDAMEHSRWRDFGSDFMVTSNINDHVVCSEGTGSLVEDRSGTISCTNVANIAPACSGVVPTAYADTTAVVRGPRLNATGIMYYWEGDAVSNWPTHDPCALNTLSHKSGVSQPEGQIWVRF